MSIDGGGIIENIMRYMALFGLLAVFVGAIIVYNITIIYIALAFFNKPIDNKE